MIDKRFLIKKLPVNTKGRDFVCGDIHGSFSCVQRFLKEINFDKSVDRLICAGDLVDRGPQNEECIKLLYEPWFFSTKGNHEQLMQDYFTDGPYGIYWNRNGGVWGIEYKHDDSDTATFVKNALVDVVKTMPYLMTVDMRNGKKFHVLHAELCAQDKITDEDLADPDRLYEIATKKTMDGDTIIWGRFYFQKVAVFGALDERAIRKIQHMVDLERNKYFFNDKLSHIYSGHTILKRPVQFIGQTNLDTGAYKSYGTLNRYNSPDIVEWAGLTITEPETQKFWFVNDREFKEVQPVIFK